MFNDNLVFCRVCDGQLLLFCDLDDCLWDGVLLLLLLVSLMLSHLGVCFDLALVHLIVFELKIIFNLLLFFIEYTWLLSNSQQSLWIQ